MFGQDGWILAKVFICVFMAWDAVEVHKLARKERGQYPAILTEQKKSEALEPELRELIPVSVAWSGYEYLYSPWTGC